jgi:hypothetical protein
MVQDVRPSISLILISSCHSSNAASIEAVGAEYAGRQGMELLLADWGAEPV